MPAYRNTVKESVKKTTQKWGGSIIFFYLIMALILDHTSSEANPSLFGPKALGYINLNISIFKKAVLNSFECMTQKL